MKTIAVSVDEPTLEALDRLASVVAAGGAPALRGKAPRRRSEVVRAALHEYLSRNARAEAERQEKLVFARHRRRLADQAAALVSEQRRP